MDLVYDPGLGLCDTTDPNGWCYQGNPCPNVTAVISAFAGNPDAATYYAQAQALGCTQSVPAAAATPSIQGCSISLYERPVVQAGIPTGGYHTFIDASVTFSNGTSNNLIIDGGPIIPPPLTQTNPTTGVPNPSPYGLGLLYGWVTQGTTGIYNADNPLTSKEIGSPYTGAAACGGIASMVSDVASYDSGTLARYAPVPAFLGGFNSNSLTWSLLNAVGLGFSDRRVKHHTGEQLLLQLPVQLLTPAGRAPTREYDSNPPVPVQYRGLIYSSVTPAKTTATTYYPWGTIATVGGSDGTYVTASADQSTNYAAPQTITAQSYTSTIGYTSWLGVAQTTGPNGDQLTMAYDQYGRPTPGTSAYGGVTTFSYNTSAPFTQTESGPSGVTITTLDGFGRAVLVQRGDSTTADATTSYTASVYAPCACSPLGKLQKVSMPYPSGGSASAWTTYTYDGLGRTVSQQKPDGASTTQYAYAGNQTTVTDPAGKWKTTTTDVSGNMTQVLEPDPANQPGGTVTTNYTYDWMGHVTQVSMPRGSTTQMRTFVYDNAGRLISATNPENGTVTYTYNTTNTLASKTDAKGQTTVYTYDSNNRVTMVQRYPQGVNYSEDTCQRATYTYDSNPVNANFSQYSLGRLTTVQYGCGIAPILGGQPTGGPAQPSFIEMYSYHPAGGVTAKQLIYAGDYYDTNQTLESATGTLEADYTFDAYGRVATLVNPANPLSYPTGSTDNYGNPIYAQCSLTFAYDVMGRPSTVGSSPYFPGDYPEYGCPGNWVQNVQYDYAGRQTSAQYMISGNVMAQQWPNTWYNTETRSYNVNGQLASITWPNNYPISQKQYAYSATQNNGQITQEVDGYSGGTATTSYQYDALKRLTSAAMTQTGSTGTTPWTETFQYDGFGNLTQKVLNGTSTPIPVNGATNRLTNAYYDANGNMTSGAGATFTYDEANRIASVTTVAGGQETFLYAPDNKRVYRLLTSGEQEITFYGGRGEKLGVFEVGGASEVCTYQGGTRCTNIFSFRAEGMTLSFNGRKVEEVYYNATNPVLEDRVGSNAGGFYPYGDQSYPTIYDGAIFATYNRDAYSGIDYADQRFYASSYGRFLTPDPMGAKAANPNDPESWNRYAYAIGDPVNRNDPNGLCPPGYVPATTSAGPDQGIVNTAETYVGQGLQHSNGHFATNPSTGQLTGIDCTGLIMMALAGISYTSGVFQPPSTTNITTGNLATLFSTTSTVQVGDIVVPFPGHAVIVTGVNAQGQITSFVGSQNTTGPANVSTSNASWSPSAHFAGWGALLAKAVAAGQVYNPAAPCVPAGTQAYGGGGGDDQAQYASMWQNMMNYMPGLAEAFLESVDSIPVGGDPYEVDETITYQ
jgi:RHS repeat-associated protein